jgi:hypothetical protein
LTITTLWPANVVGRLTESGAVWALEGRDDEVGRVEELVEGSEAGVDRRELDPLRAVRLGLRRRGVGGPELGGRIEVEQRADALDLDEVAVLHELAATFAVGIHEELEDDLRLALGDLADDLDAAELLLGGDGIDDPFVRRGQCGGWGGGCRCRGGACGGRGTGRGRSERLRSSGGSHPERRGGGEGGHEECGRRPGPAAVGAAIPSPGGAAWR